MRGTTYVRYREVCAELEEDPANISPGISTHFPQLGGELCGMLWFRRTMRETPQKVCPTSRRCLVRTPKNHRVQLPGFSGRPGCDGSIGAGEAFLKDLFQWPLDDIVWSLLGPIGTLMDTFLGFLSL